MTKRAIVYARVSTDEQAESGFSLDAQVKAGCKYAEIHGFTVAFELKDEGVSGAMPFNERPAGATACALLLGGKAEALIVQNVDRLSRDVVDLLVIIRELLRAGVEVHCLDLGRVTSEYDIMLVIRGWQGSDERQKIKARSMRGKREKLAQGMIVGGCLPYGYDHLRDAKGRVVNFTINEEQATVVRLIFKLYTQGDDASGPLSLREIGYRLGLAGISTQRSARSKRNIWDASDISRIISNPTYKGKWYYTAHATDDLPEEIFVIEVPAIVNTETWEAAQVQRERNLRKAKRNGKHDYLLTGIVNCNCGYTMSGASKPRPERNSKDFYYVCGSKYLRDERQCTQGSINADVLDAAAWDAILDVIKNPAKLKEKLRKAQQAELEELEPKRAELAAVEAMIAEAEAEAIHLEQALRNAGKVVGKVLKEKMAALDERYERLEARKAALETALAKRRLTDETIDGLLQFAAKVEKGIDCATNEVKRRVLDAFDSRVIVTDDRAELIYRLEVQASIELQLCTRSAIRRRSSWRRKLPFSPIGSYGNA